MDILIKNMEMPKERKMFMIEPDGSVWIQIADTSYFCTGSKAVALPSHGRLIDADALIKKTRMWSLVRGDEYFELRVNNEIVKELLDAVPTIVEASNE